MSIMSKKCLDGDWIDCFSINKTDHHIYKYTFCMKGGVLETWFTCWGGLVSEYKHIQSYLENFTSYDFYDTERLILVHGI